MFSAKRIYTVILILLSLSLVYCASAPQKQMAKDTDVASEIAKIDEQLKMARQEQLNVFSPKNYRFASEALDATKRGVEKNQSRKSILRSLGDARGYTDKTFQNGERVKRSAEDIVLARQLAVQAGALYLSKEELEKADFELTSYTEDLEADEKAKVDPRQNITLQGRYLDLEMETIRRDKLGTALAYLESAKDAEADKHAPDTLKKAEETYAKAEQILVTARNDQSLYGPAIVRATDQARKLLKMTLTAKNAKKMTPQQMALEINAQQAVIDQNLRASRAQKAKAEAQKEQIVAAGKSNRALASDIEYQNKIKKIEEQFDKKEAEIFRQGENFVIRLKDLEIPEAKAELPESSKATLTKVSLVIKDLAADKVIIEGHTDAVGEPEDSLILSQKRAESVGQFLLKDKSLTPGAVTTLGRGFKNPLAENKTEAGRALNRRVDVIIRPQRI